MRSYVLGILLSVMLTSAAAAQQPGGAVPRASTNDEIRALLPQFMPSQPKAAPEALARTGAPSQANGVDLPLLNVDAACEAHAQRSATSEYNRNMYRHACMDSEQTAYDMLKLMWLSFSDETRSLCIKFVDKPAFQYTLLRDCAMARHQGEVARRQGEARPAPFRY